MHYLILLIFFSCSLPGLRSDGPSHDHGQKYPSWASETVQYCKEEKLCAVGEAGDSTKAETRARDNLARIFSTKIVANSQVRVSFEGGADDPSKKSEEEYVSLIRESTELLLEGVIIEARLQSGQSHFALASLEKQLGARVLRNKIQGLDEQIEALYQTNRRGNLTRAVKLFKAREALLDRYLILRPLAISPPVSLGLVMKKLFSLRKGKVVLMEKNEPDDPFSDTLIQELTGLGYKVVIDETSEFDVKVQTTFNLEEEYLNVKGFKKFTVSFSMAGLDTKGQKLGQVVLKLDRTGRSRQDILYKSGDEMVKSIKEHINKLNLDLK